MEERIEEPVPGSDLTGYATLGEMYPPHSSAVAQIVSEMIRQSSDFNINTPYCREAVVEAIGQVSEAMKNT